MIPQNLSFASPCRALVYHRRPKKGRDHGQARRQDHHRTGATSGIGRRTVEIFVQEGREGAWRPAAARNSAARSRRARQGQCLFVKADATKEADVKAMFEACLAKWGRLDCLFNNAGGPAPVGGIETIPVEGFDAAMATLVRSVMLGMKHAAPIMMKQGSGSIINNGSIAGRRAGYSTSMIYGAAKAAVNHLTVCAPCSSARRTCAATRSRPAASPPASSPRRSASSQQGRRYAEAAAKNDGHAAAHPRAGRTDDIAMAAVFPRLDDSTFINGHDSWSKAAWSAADCGRPSTGRAGDAQAVRCQ
jgi:NAD(P)-dependent dehydrogenase (short-subunit alcohol dehydrogenase family)